MDLYHTSCHDPTNLWGHAAPHPYIEDADTHLSHLLLFPRKGDPRRSRYTTLPYFMEKPLVRRGWFLVRGQSCYAPAFLFIELPLRSVPENPEV
jgi:hypothetical protein